MKKTNHEGGRKSAKRGGQKVSRVLRQDGEVTATERAKGKGKADRGETERRGVWGGWEAERGRGERGREVNALKCLGQIILGRQSIFPGI